jgi:hypothetical protein
MTQKRQPVTTLHGGCYRYTLVAVTRDGVTAYTISATDGEEVREMLEGFTDNECLAEAYLTLLAHNAIDPRRMGEVWEDMLA